MLRFLRQQKQSQTYSKQMRREVMFLTWPAFIELVMSTLFSMIDMIMVGPAQLGSDIGCWTYYSAFYGSVGGVFCC